MKYLNLKKTAVFGDVSKVERYFWPKGLILLDLSDCKMTGCKLKSGTRVRTDCMKLQGINKKKNFRL